MVMFLVFSFPFEDFATFSKNTSAEWTPNKRKTCFSGAGDKLHPKSHQHAEIGKQEQTSPPDVGETRFSLPQLNRSPSSKSYSSLWVSVFRSQCIRSVATKRRTITGTLFQLSSTLSNANVAFRFSQSTTRMKSVTSGNSKSVKLLSQLVHE